MAVRFCFDAWPMPNLVNRYLPPGHPERYQLSKTWPYSEPPQLLSWLDDHSIEYSIVDSVNSEAGDFYLIALGFFDFDIDYFSLMPSATVDRVRKKKLQVVFDYREGDNPLRIRSRIDQLCWAHQLDPNLVKIISGNTAADGVKNMLWFPHFELIYQKSNQQHAPENLHDLPRGKLFTALVRLPKWWRATVMAEIARRGWTNDGYFSFNTALGFTEKSDENPISIDFFPGLRVAMTNFLKKSYTADSLSHQEHNSHDLHQSAHFSNSYLNVVLETHFDADQSNGAFITEKTFKPIKHGQPFIIFGTAHSVKTLKTLGYRTFDDIVDSSYDSLEDPNQRFWEAVNLLDLLLMMGDRGLHDLYQKCWSDLVHNQKMFLASKADRLNTLLEKLQC